MKNRTSYLGTSLLCLLFLLPFTSSGLFAQEICNNGFDDDNDGLVDCYDPDCSGNTSCTGFFVGGASSYNCGGASIGSYTLDTAWASPIEVLPAATPVAGDIDGDGVVEIVVCRGLNPTPTDTILVINGITGAIENRFTTGFVTGGAKGDVIALGDIDNDGLGEIILIALDRSLRAFEHDGTLKWVSATNVETSGSPSITDFDQDGNPEVYCGRQVWNGQTGVILATGTGSRGEGQTALHTVAADVLPTPFCTDCDGLELVAGNQVYAVNVGTGTMTVRSTYIGQVNDGTVSVVDWDNDGDLDGVVSAIPTPNGPIGLARLFVWDLQTPNLINTIKTFPGNVSNYGGTPTISDFDGDGRPEVAVIGYNSVVVFDDYLNNMNQLWSRTLSDDSGVTNSCAFDFDVDGAAELVCRDQDSLFIFAGASGAVKGTLPMIAGTINERPVVVDHDGDGEAEILVVGATPVITSRIGSLISVEPRVATWASSRKIWNQVHYVNVNINDDLSVPQSQQAHQLFPFLNNFNQQSNLLDSLGIPFGFTGGPGGLAQVNAQYSEVVTFYDVDFTNMSTGAGISSIGWDFGDGTSSSLPNPSHTYATPGIYTVCLTVVNACDADTICRNVTIACPVPTAGFSSTIANDTVTFLSQAPGAPGTSLLWDFGDGTTDTTLNPQHVYASFDTFTVCLIVTNPCGADTLCQDVIVTCPVPAPIAGFTSIIGGSNVILVDQSIGTGLAYSWSFNGDTASQSNPTFPVPTANGDYEICLIVTNQCGADSLCDTINVNLTGIWGNDQADQLVLFPVPASENVWIEGNTPFKEGMIASWIDIMGRRISTAALIKESDTRFRISTSELAEGMYLLELQTSTATWNHRVWIQR